jgi:cellulose synthase/poly-beta-1,6-N-acetylglucosamine synthase-like glycosyltransferase
MTSFVSRHRSSQRAEGSARLPAGRESPGLRHVYPLLSEERLLCHAGLAPCYLERLRALALRWGVSMRRAAIATGLVTRRDEARAIAELCGFRSLPPGEDIALAPVASTPEPYRLLASRAPLPLAHRSQRGLQPERGTSDADQEAGALARGGATDAVLNAAAFTPEQLADLSASLGPARARLAVADSVTLVRAIAWTHGPALAKEAAGGLAQRRPCLSAAHGICRWQAVFLVVAAGLFAGSVIFTPREAVAIYSAALSLMFLITIGMRLAAAGHAALRHISGGGPPLRRPRDYELPAYTVLVAMYREARVLPDLVEGLMSLNYPAAKLDIKLVLEEVDAETLAAARALHLPAHIQIVIVPDGSPRTKPRALNYALQFATGDLLVIYDAEDRPEPDQLMKAAAHFRLARPEVVCLQARLTFDNASENWLAKQFTIEYASLFGGMLPMLDAARLPLPLGGTSNHFRVAALRRVGGWDPHNVTEDADLGMRLYRRALRAEVLDSVTYEEACCQPWPWLKQRTRWLKGWIQTYGVHMRQPYRLVRELGLAGFLAFQGHFAGVIVAALVHPISYVLLFHDAVMGVLFDGSGAILGRHMVFLAIFNLIAGYGASLALGWFALRGRRVRKLAPQLVFIPLYWLLISAACYRAVYQLIRAPHLWEKTEHGVSSQRQRRKARS